MATTTIDLSKVRLSVGSHQSPEDGMCLMEAVSLLAGERFSDSPPCACPVISAFCRTWQDDLDDDTRQRLLPYAERIVGTRSTKAVEQKRAWLVTDWLVREHTPAWLETAGLVEQAAALRALPELTSAKAAKSAQPAIDAAREAGAAAWAAAWAAAGDAAGAAARAAAGDAAGAAAGDAAGDAAWAAAGAAAWAAARAAAGDAAWDAAYGEAKQKATERLAPTRDKLVESAFLLLDRLIEVRGGE